MSIRRPLPEMGGSSDAPPPPAYTATAPPAVYNQRQPPQPQASPQGSSATSSSRPMSTSQMPSSSRPLSSAQAPNRPGSMAVPPSQAGQASNLARSNSREDRLAVLRRYDTLFLIDDSASMYPLWHEAESALAGIVETIITYDTDGVDVAFLNSTHVLNGAKSAHEIRELFQFVGPNGESTPTELRVEQLLSPYIEACEKAKKQGQALPKPLNMLVLTDGEADDGPTLAYVLSGFAKRLDDMHAPLTQLGVQFIQIGNDAEATAALQELDDELQGVRDMVDTTPYQGQITSDFIVKVALGSINRRIDRQN